MAANFISVLVDSYNYGRYIGEAVESVLNQDFPSERMELLVVDDGSTDDTADRLRRYGPKVRYLYKPNGGQASAVNFGLEQARGDIVAFLDADDYWLPQKLRRIAEEFERRLEVGTVYHNFCTLHPDGKFRDGGFNGQSGFLPESRHKLLRFDVHPTSALAFRRNMLQRILPVPQELVLQADAYLMACAIFIAPVSYLSEKLMVYRIHGSNLWNIGGVDHSERVARRLRTTRAVGAGVRGWLLSNGLSVDRSPLHNWMSPTTPGPSLARARLFLRRWRLIETKDQFRLKPPGRLHLFFYQVKHNVTFHPTMSRKLFLYNWGYAFAVLFFGREGSRYLESTRTRIKQLRRFVARRFRPARQASD